MNYKLIIALLGIVLFSCESDPINVDSVSGNISYDVLVFDEISSESISFIDDTKLISDSWRLYAGEVGDVQSSIVLKISPNQFNNQNFCSFDTADEQIDSVKLVIRSFNQLQEVIDGEECDNDTILPSSETMLIDPDGLEIKVQLYSEDENLDSLSINNTISSTVNNIFETISPLSSDYYEISDYEIYVDLYNIDGLDIDWCSGNQQDLIFLINYSTDDIDTYSSFLELRSSEYVSGGFLTTYRPNIEFNYIELEDANESINKYHIQDVSSDNSNLSDNLYVSNASGNSGMVYLFKTSEASELIDIYINEDELMLPDIPMLCENDCMLTDSNEGSFLITLSLDLNTDSLDVNGEALVSQFESEGIDFLFDDIIVRGSSGDYAGDNFIDSDDSGGWNEGEGFEGNAQYDVGELYFDFGLDECPDEYESGNLDNPCLCNDPIDNIADCYSMFDYELVYNIGGTENNGEYDGSYDSFGDTGVDGCTDKYEDGLGGCALSELESAYDLETNFDPNGDNYNIDPDNDNWEDLNDNNSYDEGEGTELNEQYDGPIIIDEIEYPGEFYLDIGIDGLTDEQELLCPLCEDDNWSVDNPNGTEGNGQYDVGEYFQDTGIDGMASSEYENYNANQDGGGTEKNKGYDQGEPLFHDCGLDNLCDINEIDYDSQTNPDPAGDNWNDCGTDGLCEGDDGWLEPDNDLTEGNNVWDIGEGLERNGIKDSGEKEDCGIDGLCNEEESNDCGFDTSDPANDDYNIDPNNDNWNDCGLDGICPGDCGNDGICPNDFGYISPDVDGSEYISPDEDGSESDGIWNISGENYEGCEGDTTWNYIPNIGEEKYRDWGLDQLADSLEAFENSNLITYLHSSSYNFDYLNNSNVVVDDNSQVNLEDGDEQVVINFESFEYILEGEEQKILVNILVEYSEPIHSMQFRVKHVPYLYQYEFLSENKVNIHQVDGIEIAQDFSSYSTNNEINSFIDSYYDLTTNYSNSVGFKLIFNGLIDTLNNNPEIYIDSLNTKLFLYPDTLNTKYIKNGDFIGLSLKSSLNEYPEHDKVVLLNDLNVVELRVANILKDYMNETDNTSLGEIDVFSNHWYNGFSNIIFHGYDAEDELLKPRLEIYYSK